MFPTNKSISFTSSSNSCYFITYIELNYFSTFYKFSTIFTIHFINIWLTWCILNSNLSTISCPYLKSYNSWGNGAPMRCSPAGWLASSPEKAFELGMYTAGPTHNHPEAMKAAGVTAMLIWHARHGMPKPELRELAEKWYSLPVLDEIRAAYTFDVSCAGTMPVALSAFFESTGFEDAIRNAVSVGGDSDTIAAITGSLAEAYYGVPEELWQKACRYLSDELIRNVTAFYTEAEKISK